MRAAPPPHRPPAFRALHHQPAFSHPPRPPAFPDRLPFRLPFPQVGNLQEAGHAAASKLAAIEAEYSGKLSDALGEIQGLRRQQEEADNKVAAVQAEFGRKLAAAEKQVRRRAGGRVPGGRRLWWRPWQMLWRAAPGSGYRP